MAAECPVCRTGIPWHRTFRTSAWGKWRCDGCESLLTVDIRWRFVALGVAVAAMFSATRVVRAPQAWDLPVVVVVMSTVMIPYFLFLERARVLDRCGFRCQGCGYDLRGQSAARCPECGQNFNPDELARVQKSYSAVQPGSKVARRTGVVLVTLVLVFVTTVLLVVGTAKFGRSQDTNKSLSLNASRTSVAPPANPTRVGD